MPSRLSLFFFCCIMAMASTVKAQFDTQSPYSYYGIGVPAGSNLQNGFAMGSVSQGLRDSAYLNPYNPASYTSLDVTQLNFGFEGNFLTRDEYGRTFHNNNIFVNNFGLGIPVMHKHRFFSWGMYLGYAPISNVGYKLSDSGTVVLNSDTILARYQYLGSGGFNKLTWGHGFQFGKHFSIGFNFHYLFGVATRRRTVELPADQGYLSTRVDEKTRINAFAFDAGFQTYFDIEKYGKKDTSMYRLILGGTYRYGANINAGFEQYGFQYLAGTSADYNLDTFLLNPSLTGTLTLPHSFGFGAGFVKPQRWGLYADFNYTLWSGFYYFDQPTVTYKDSYSAHLGFEFTPKFPGQYEKGRFLKNIVYRFGARYYNRFYQPDGNPIDELGFSFGFGLPFGFDKRFDDNGNVLLTKSYINFGLEGGIAQSRNGGVVNESFFRFTVGFTLRDKWFRKFYYN